MNILDILILLALVVGFVVGYQSGVVRQIGSLVSFAIAVVACYLFGGAASEVACSVMGVTAESNVQARATASIAGHVALFLAVWMLLWLVVRMVHMVVTAVHLGLINRLLGALFMVLKIAVMASVLLNVWKAVAPSSDLLAASGRITSMTMEVGPKLLGVAESINF